VSDIGLAKEKTIAVVVTHQPDAGLSARFGQLAQQFNRVIVVDNHSQDAALAAVRDLDNSRGNVSHIFNDENVGIAAALNQGCRFAAEHGADWVAMFDQDSTPAEDLLIRLENEWQTEPDRARIGLIGVNFQSKSGKTLLPAGTGLIDARVVITSGSLLNLSAWQQVGPFREDFFIDEVDHEYAIRLRRNGWHVKVSRRLLMEHAIGSPRSRRLGGWQPVLSHHSPLRRYYMVRNRILLAREHIGFDPRFVASQLARSIRETATVLVFEPQKLDKLIAMSRGIIDGFRGRTGRAAWHAREHVPS